MSREIDERIVDMKFNNQQFETGVATSLSSLEKLKKGLNLTGATRGLGELSSAAGKFSLAGIAQGAETITKKFSALGIVGVTALVNISNQALNTGKQIVSSLTIDPIKAGFSEYELKMGSIQTIMAGTGASLEDVNEKLNELNTYSDKTIYSFADMTTNIGKFTNAGVSLNDSVGAIQGISNAAALSGANANEASRAMYNFAQAISTGSVKLIDWKSIELANMGTVEFKTQLLDGAVAAGEMEKGADGLYYVLSKGKRIALDGISATQGFTGSLEHQWMTSEVLINTLNKYSDATTDIGKRAFAAAQDVKTLSQMYDTLKEAAQSGWAQTWEIIAGDFNEGKALWTELNDAISGIIGKSADARNEMLLLWDKYGGRAAVIQSFRNALEKLGEVLKPISEAFREFFPKKTYRDLVKISYAILNFTRDLEITSETTDKIKRIFRGVFALLDIGRQAFVAIAKAIGKFAGKLGPTVDTVTDFAASLGDWLVSLSESAKKGDVFTKFIDKVADGISKAAIWIKGAVQKIKEGFAGLVQSFDKIRGVNLTGIESFTEKLQLRFEPIITLGKKIGEAFKWLYEVIKGWVQKISIRFDYLSVIGTGIGKAINFISEKIGSGGSKVEGLTTKMKDSFAKFGAAVAPIFKGIGDWFKKLFENFSFKNLTDAANTGLFAGLVAIVGKFSKSMTDLLSGGLLAGIGVAAVKFINSLSTITANAAGVFKGVTNVLDGVKDTLKAYQSQLKAGALLKIAISIGILAAAILVLAMIDSQRLLIATAAITVLFADLAASMAVFQKVVGGPNSKGLATASLALVAMSTSLLIMAGAVSMMAKIDSESLKRGLGAFTVIFAETAAFMKLTEKTKAAKGLGLVSLGISLILFAKALQKFSALDQGTLIKGIGVMTTLLAILAAFTLATKSVQGTASTAIGLVILAASLLIFAEAIKKIGEIPFEVLKTGLWGIGFALALVTGALALMPADMLVKSIGLAAISGALIVLGIALSNMGGMTADEIKKSLITLAAALTIIVAAVALMSGGILGAAAILVISGALFVLAGVLKILGAMSLQEIGIALLAMAGVFVVLGLAALVLGPLVPVLIALSVAMGLLGLASLAIGAGLLLFSAGLAALAISGAAGAAVLVVAVKSILELIPLALEMLGKGIIAFAKVISESYPTLFSAMRTVLLSLIAAITAVGPKAITALLGLLNNLLRQLAVAVPEMVRSGMRLILGILKGIGDNIKAIVTAGTNIVLGFLRGVTEKLPAVIDGAFKLIIAFINGLADAIRKNHVAIYNAVDNLVSAIINALTNLNSRFKDAGKNILNGMISGIKAKVSDLVDAAAAAAKKGLEAVKKFLGIRSPSTEFADVGRFSILGLAEGLKKFAGKAVAAAKDVGVRAKDSMAKALSTVADVVSGNIDTNPTIRPVLDLTDVMSGSKRLDGMMGNRGIAVSGTAAQASAASQVVSANIGAQVSREMKVALDELKGAFKGALDTLTVAQPQVNFNGSYSFAGQEDIDYFMNQAALLVQRRKG